MILVLHPGLCDLVMDLGRPGRGALGVPAGGAADPAALAAANRLAGNPATAAGLEIVLSGPTLCFQTGAVVALTGARFGGARDSGAPLRWNETLVLAPGETLRLDHAEAGARCWLAVHGGLAVPSIMGSGSTFLPGGFGGHQGRALRAGDALTAGAGGGKIVLRRARPPVADAGAALRVLAGPQAGRFDDAGLAAFFGGDYRVDAASDRRGVRLRGAVVSYPRADWPSQGVLPGAIQVPPDGQPIILGWDGPVTGGYPLIVAVAAVDGPRLAQLKPGDAVRFETIDRPAALGMAGSPGQWRIEDIG